MSPSDFVEFLKLRNRSTARSAVDSATRVNPMKENEKSSRRSAIFATMTKEQQDLVHFAAQETADLALFVFLVTLDGECGFGKWNPGHFEVYYINDNSKFLLNDPTKEMLHDML